MKKNDTWKTALSIWGCSTVSIVTAIYFTHSMNCLWFLLIPSVMYIMSGIVEEDNTNGRK